MQYTKITVKQEHIALPCPNLNCGGSFFLCKVYLTPEIVVAGCEFILNDHKMLNYKKKPMKQPQLTTRSTSSAQYKSDTDLLLFVPPE